MYGATQILTNTLPAVLDSLSTALFRLSLIIELQVERIYFKHFTELPGPEFLATVLANLRRHTLIHTLVAGIDPWNLGP